MSLLAVSLGPIGALDEGQKLESARRQTRGGGGLGALGALRSRRIRRRTVNLHLS
jgi:hypothetical protein